MSKPENNDKQPGKKGAPKCLLVSTIRGVDSFNRCGLRFTSKPTEVDISDWPEEKVKLLLSEKLLHIEQQ